MNEFYPQVSGIWLRIGKLTKRGTESLTLGHSSIQDRPVTCCPLHLCPCGRASSLHLPVAFTSTQVGTASRNLERWKGRNAVWVSCTVQPCWGLCITRPLRISPQAEAAGQDGRVLQTHLRRRPPHGAAGQVPGKCSEPIPAGLTPSLWPELAGPLSPLPCAPLLVWVTSGPWALGSSCGEPLRGQIPVWFLLCPHPPPLPAPRASRAESPPASRPQREPSSTGSGARPGTLTSERGGPGKQDAEGGAGTFQPVPAGHASISCICPAQLGRL